MQHISDEQYKALLSQANAMIEERAEKLKRAVSARAAVQLKKECTPDRSQFEECGNDWENILKIMLDIGCFASIFTQVKFSRKDRRTAYTKESICQKADICGLDEQLKYQLCRKLGFDYEEPLCLLKRRYQHEKWEVNHSKEMMEKHAQKYNNEQFPKATRDFHFKMYSKCKDELEKAERRMTELSQELAARGESVN